MISRVIVVDDDSNFRKSIVRSLEMNEYEVIEASNGKEALGILNLQSVDLILSDVKMPILNGIEFLHRIKRDKGDIPFIMMTGFSEVIEIKEAYEIGADGFLAKPYREDDLMAQIHKFSGEASDEKPDAKFDYIAVSIDEFVAGANIKYAVHMRFEEDKFEKVANEGETITNHQVAAFKAKGIDFLYVHKNDFIEFINFNLSIKPSILRSYKLGNLKKLKFVKILLNHMTRFVFANGPDENILNEMLVLQSDLLKLIKDGNLLYFMKDIIKEDAQDSVEKSTLAAIIGTYILSKLDWGDDEQLNTFIWGCCLQDVSLGLYNSHEGKEHPLASAKIIQDWNLFDNKFFNMILHHHEKIDGSGYPSSLKGSQICKKGNLICLCDHMVELMINGMGFDFKSAKEWVVENEGSCYRPDFLAVLEKMEPPRMEAA